MSRSGRQRVASMAVGAAIAVLLVRSVRAQAEASDEPSAATASALRARGLQLAYNLDHADALSAFTDAIAADPSDSRAYRLVAATAWIDLVFEQGAIKTDANRLALIEYLKTL